VEAVWGPFGDPVGGPVVLGRRSSPYVMTLIQLNEATGDATYLNATATSAGCNDVTYVNNEFGQPGLLVVCGINGFDARYYTEIGGVPEVRTPSQMGNTNLGNTGHVEAHPSGDYALIISWSGDAIYRFDAGLLCSYSEAVRFSTRRLWNVRFQQHGARALVTGKKQTISSNSFGGMFEFRHDYFQCPQPLVTCDVNEVSIPSFGSAPWVAPDNTLIADVAWRPGCDGGVIVGGYSNYSTNWGFVGTFQLVGGAACW
jgi:hypothetical protein